MNSVNIFVYLEEEKNGMRNGFDENLHILSLDLWVNVRLQVETRASRSSPSRASSTQRSVDVYDRLKNKEGEKG